MTKKNKLSVLLGKRGTGKTYLAKKKTEFKTRVLAFDTIKEFDKKDYKIVSSIEELETQMQKETFHIRVWDEYNDEDFFNKVCEVAYLHEDFIFFIDEIDQNAGATFCPKGLKKIVNYGRHKNIELICTARSPAEIPKMLIGQMTDLYMFRIIEPNHLKYLSGIYDGDINKIRTLADYKFVHFKT